MPAGYETTSTAISYALYEIARNPLVQQKLQEEVDMFGCDRELSFDDLCSFPYAEAVFFEGMRLHPPVTPFIALVSSRLFFPCLSPCYPHHASIHYSTAVCSMTCATLGTLNNAIVSHNLQFHTTLSYLVLFNSISHCASYEAVSAGFNPPGVATWALESPSLCMPVCHGCGMLKCVYIQHF